MAIDPYDRFAEIYDLWQSAYSKPFSEAILPFYEREILSRGSPDASLVDLTCGTGTFLSLWHRRHPGWLLAGFDGSPGMIRQARSNLAGVRPAPLLRRQRLERLRSSRRFGVAICMFDSINHLTRCADLRRALSGVSKLLLPRGLFLFDLNDERAFRRLFAGEWTVAKEGLRVAASARLSHAGKFGIVRFDVAARTGGRLSRRIFEIRERNWTCAEVTPALAAAGLEVIRILRVRPYPARDVDTPRTLWVCRSSNLHPPQSVDPRHGGAGSRPADPRGSRRRGILTAGVPTLGANREGR